MAEITLSTKECLLAAAKLGAKKFFGLSDPFFGMPIEEVRREIGELQLSMEKKGYADVGFDDVFALKPAVAELMTLCTGCDSYLLGQLMAPGEKERQVVIYAGKAGFARACVRGETVTLARVEEGAISQTLLDEMRPSASGSNAPVSTQVKQSDLAQVQSLAIDDPGAAEAQLAGQGCPAPISEILVQGFRKETGRYAFFHTDLQARTLTQMIALQGGSGAVCMTLENADEDLWTAQYLPGGITAEVLEPICPWKGDGHEVR